jgi:hypothetical protein
MQVQAVMYPLLGYATNMSNPEAGALTKKNQSLIKRINKFLIKFEMRVIFMVVGVAAGASSDVPAAGLCHQPVQPGSRSAN